MDNAPKRKSPFSTVYQVGVVVRDMDQAVRYYEALGIGPFESPKGTAPILERQVYGKPDPDGKNRIRKTQMGSVELELVQPISGKSVQGEFLEKHGEGVNHLGFLVDQLDLEVARLLEKGFRVISRGELAEGQAVADPGREKVGGVVGEWVEPPGGS